MNELLCSPKIKPEHLARRAIVYLRQSSEKQVRQNKESQRLQYDVAERMRGLGWKDVEIIDNDLGSSAAMASARREGFERVLSSVALGEVGIVGSREVSRLSRTDKDWCRLLEVCQIFGTLIADEQHIYDLNYLDDQLVLGIKGTLSVVELKVLRQRMQAGQESKARRGELFKRLPVGYVLDGLGKVVFHPDRRVSRSHATGVHKFRELWSVRQTFPVVSRSRRRAARQPHPRNTARLEDSVAEPNPRHSMQSVLRRRLCVGTSSGQDPAGRGQAGEAAGRDASSRRMPGLYPRSSCGYIDWATYEENQRMIRRNSVNWEATNPWRRSVPDKACWWDFCAVDIVVASFMCVTGAGAELTRVISARETTTTADSIASVLVAPRWIAGWSRAVEGDLAISGWKRV